MDPTLLVSWFPHILFPDGMRSHDLTKLLVAAFLGWTLDCISTVYAHESGWLVG